MQQGVAGNKLLGSQIPTHLLVPPATDYSDVEAVLDLAAVLGIELDPWQVTFFEHALARRIEPNGETKWAAFNAVIECSRQNGKSVLLELRALAGLFVFGEKSIVYTAHNGDTVMNTYRRLVALIEGAPSLKRLILKTTAGNGKEAIYLRDPKDPTNRKKYGGVITFRTRTANGGRGLTGDCVIIDEAQDATDVHTGALVPLMAARTEEGDPQMWYGGSAGGQHSTVLGRFVKRCEAELARRRDGGEPGERKLMMARFAADLDVDDPRDPKVHARVNPAYGRRIHADYFEDAFLTMGADVDPQRFAREHLGVGDYPRTDGEDWIIARRRWEGAEDPKSTMVGPVLFSVEVRQDRSSTSITAAGFRPDGAKHIELVAQEKGVTWAVLELKRLTAAHDSYGVAIDPQSPAKTLIEPLHDAGVIVHDMHFSDLTEGWGKLYDALSADVPGIYHTGGIFLTAALAAAEVRDLGGGTTWKRATAENSAAILAATWAAHMLDKVQPEETGVSRRAVPRSQEDPRGRPAPRRFTPGIGRGGFDPRTSRF